MRVDEMWANFKMLTAKIAVKTQDSKICSFWFSFEFQEELVTT